MASTIFFYFQNWGHKTTLKKSSCYEYKQHVAVEEESNNRTMFESTLCFIFFFNFKKILYVMMHILRNIMMNPKTVGRPLNSWTYAFEPEIINKI